MNKKKIKLFVWIGYGLTTLAVAGGSMINGFIVGLSFGIGFTAPLLVFAILITLELNKKGVESKQENEVVNESTPVKPIKENKVKDEKPKGNFFKSKAYFWILIGISILFLGAFIGLFIEFPFFPILNLISNIKVDIYDMIYGINLSLPFLFVSILLFTLTMIKFSKKHKEKSWRQFILKPLSMIAIILTSIVSITMIAFTL